MSGGAIAASYVAGGGAPTILVADTFTRADSAASMGTTETGAQTWTADSGTWGISSNRAYLASGGGASKVSVGVGTNQYAIEVTCVVGGGAGVLFRYVSGTVGWFFNFNRQSIYTLNGGFSEKTLGLGAASNGDTFRIEVESGGATRVYKNGSGTALCSWTESWQLAATRVGLLADDSTPRFDNLTVYSL